MTFPYLGFVPELKIEEKYKKEEAGHNMRILGKYQELRVESKIGYLGHIIRNDLSDDDKVKCQSYKLCTYANAGT